MLDEDGFGAEGEDELPPEDDYMAVTVYFYAEEPGLRQRVFPEEWFAWADEQLGEPLDREDEPFVQVSGHPVC